MTYLVIFNGHKGVVKQQVRIRTWLEFLDELSRLVQQYGQPPDLIYLEDGRP